MLQGLAITDDIKWSMDEADLQKFQELAEANAALEEKRRARREGRAVAPISTGASSRWGTKRRATISAAVQWQEHYTDEGHTYYYCEQTGESSWEFPSGDVEVLTQLQDAEGNWYWYNQTSGVSVYM
jgi:hypothetical protein